MPNFSPDMKVSRKRKNNLELDGKAARDPKINSLTVS